MSLNNVTRTLPYDSAAVQARLVNNQLLSAGSGAVSPKFYAWTQLQIYGVTLATIVAGTSTYSYNGSATSPATTVSLLHVYNSNTTGTAVTLATDTIGPFIVGGTSTPGQNNVGGTSGGIAGGYNGPYALNTLGGTNTSQVFGTNTLVSGTATGSQIQSGYAGGGVGFGGLPMNAGDLIYFVNGTDATASTQCLLQYGIQPVNGQIVA